MYGLVMHPSPAAFLARAEAWLLRAEDLHNLVLSLAYARSAAGDSQRDALWATVEHSGEVVGCVMRTPPHKLLITDLPVDAAAAVAEAAAGLYTRLPAVLGPLEPAAAVASAWVERRGGSWRPGADQRIYRLDRVEPPGAVPGRIRIADRRDSELAIAWGEGFARDAGVQFTSAPDTIRGWIDKGMLYIWEDGEPRSIAVLHGRTPNGARVGYVYTPPEHRRRGYASACVAEVSQLALDQGLHFCVLYTDLANPTSNAIYQRIGYRPIADVRDYDLGADAAS